MLQDTDLVASDIAAGLALLHQEQDKMEWSRDPEIVIDHSPSSPMVSADKKALQQTVGQEGIEAGQQSHFTKIFAYSAFRVESENCVCPFKQNLSQIVSSSIASTP